MVEYLVLHSLDDKDGWDFCQSYDEMVELIEENRILFGDRCKVINAIRVAVADTYEHLID